MSALDHDVGDPEYRDDTQPANRITLIDVIADIGKPSFDHIFDLGDQWCHHGTDRQTDGHRTRR